MDWQAKLMQLRDVAQTCLKRVVGSDFQTISPTETELTAMSDTGEQGIKNDVSQRVAVWRRAVLMIAAACLCLTVVIEIATYQTVEDQLYDAAKTQIQSNPQQIAAVPQEWGHQQQPMQGNRGWGNGQWEQQQAWQQNGAGQWNNEMQTMQNQFGDQQEQIANAADQARQQVDQQVEVLGRKNLEIIDGIGLFLLISVIVGTILCIVAARSWSNPSRSRLLARIGFLVIFMMPFALALIPFSQMMSFGHLTDDAQRQQAEGLMSVLLGLQFVMLVAPKAIALFVGIIRSSVTLKTLIPESSLPGWTAAIVAPLYSVFIFIVLALVNQIMPDYKLLLGLGCVMAAPMVYVLKFKDMLARSTPETITSVLAPVKLISTIFSVIGFTLIAMYVMDLEVFTIGDAITLLLHLAGNTLLMTVVAADLNLELIGYEHRQSKVDHLNHLHEVLEQRFNELAEDNVAPWREASTTSNRLPMTVSAAIARQATG